jgi:acyl-CoA synthetase (NDP forming)
MLAEGTIDLLDYYKPLFYPRNLAVIGASTNPVGAVKFVWGHQTSGFKIYPVNKNPAITELYGFPVYRSILDIEDEEIDLAIIGVPKEAVPGVIEDFKQKTVKFAIIFTSGFKESGFDDLEQELVEKISEVSTRVIGPNCLGVYNPRARLVYWPTLERGPEYGGNISFVGQSGGNTAKFNMFLNSRQAYSAKSICIGNAIDIQPHDFLPYFKEDPDTEAVGFYLESTKDGKTFIKNLRDITPVKPVVIWKGGQGKVGFKATASHTGELAGDFKMWQAMARQNGAIIAEDFDLCTELMTCFSFHVPLPRGLNVAIVACGGGASVEMADMFESHGYDLPDLSIETKEKVWEFIPKEVNSSIANPVDLGEYGYYPEYFANAIDIISRDENFDAVVFLKETSRFSFIATSFSMTTEEYSEKTVETIRDLFEKNRTQGRNIPLFIIDPYINEAPEAYLTRAAFRERLAKFGIPVFPRQDLVARAIVKLHEYGKFLERVNGE